MLTGQGERSRILNAYRELVCGSAVKLVLEIYPMNVFRQKLDRRILGNQCWLGSWGYVNWVAHPFFLKSLRFEATGCGQVECSLIQK
jgi:hypothetical protein